MTINERKTDKTHASEEEVREVFSSPCSFSWDDEEQSEEAANAGRSVSADEQQNTESKSSFLHGQRQQHRN